MMRGICNPFGKYCKHIKGVYGYALQNAAKTGIGQCKHAPLFRTSVTDESQIVHIKHTIQPIISPKGWAPTVQHSSSTRQPIALLDCNKSFHCHRDYLSGKLDSQPQAAIQEWKMGKTSQDPCSTQLGIGP